jgi:DNA-binding winged helix-turn-helix (wHTH) protein
MISRLGSRRLAFGLAACLVLAVAFAAAAWFAVHSSLSRRADELCDRSLLYAAMIAATVPTWAGQSEPPDLAPLATYAALAGLVYVQVISGGEVLLGVAEIPGAEVALRDLQETKAPRAELRRVGGRAVVDVVMPYAPPHLRSDDGTASPALGSYASGTLRLGVDATAFAWAAGTTRALAAGLGALAWIAASAAIALALRLTRRRKSSPAEAVPETAPGEGRRMVAGGLVLHVDECRLSVRDLSIRLTPKQLDLLKVLMSEPGRAFGDNEILSKAWPDSPYADSRDVRQYVYLIRQRLSAHGLPGDGILANVPGVGYRIVPSAVEGLVDGSVDAPAADPGSKGAP